jgi:hypothetical protein
MMLRMRQHVDLLGALYALWGAFAVLVGTSLAILAAGTDLASMELGIPGSNAQAAVVLLLMSGALAGGVGVAALVAARALQHRAPNLVVVPFGTALALYALWVLQNDDARREFGRRAEGSARSSWRT